MSFIQFKTEKHWTAETSPFIDVLYTDTIHLIPEEWYCQEVSEEVFELGLIDCQDVCLEMDWVYVFSNDKHYIKFKIKEDYFSENLFLSINNTLFSNTFICTMDDKCFTSIIHYKDSISSCFCDTIDVDYESIRLKLAELDCNDADEVEIYHEFTTGQTRSSRALEKTFTLWELIGDKLTNNAFKRAFNSEYFYINNVRNSKTEPFNRGKRIEASNCSVSEFNTSIIKNDILVIDNDFDNIYSSCVSIGFENVEMSQSFIKNDCPVGEAGLIGVIYLVEANTYQSGISQEDADQQALNDIIANGQNYANDIGICVVVSSYEITLGRCDEDLTGATWAPIYTHGNIRVGSVFYTDSNLTIPFEGGSDSYRIRRGVVITEKGYVIDDLGVVLSIGLCEIITPPTPTELLIKSSVIYNNSNGFDGFLSFAFGEPNEILNLLFEVERGVGGSFNAVYFSSPVNVSPLLPLQIVHTGTVTLDATGDASSVGASTIQITDTTANNISIKVSITGRSSSQPIPLDYFTIINL